MKDDPVELAYILLFVYKDALLGDFKRRTDRSTFEISWGYLAYTMNYSIHDYDPMDKSVFCPSKNICYQCANHGAIEGLVSWMELKP